MNINDAFPGQFIKAADLKGQRVKVQIAKTSWEDIGGDNKLVLHFTGKDRGLVLNKTNAQHIAELTGSQDTDDWPGHSIVLYPTKTEFQGKRVDCIRIEKAATPAKAPKAAPPPEPVAEEDADSQIPF